MTTGRAGCPWRPAARSEKGLVVAEATLPRSHGEGLDEVDVLVVGYGAAGAAAALAAHDAGARVLVVEKCAQPGGSSLVSSANTVYPEHQDDVQRFSRYLTEVCDGTTPAEVIEAYVQGLVELPAWLESMGGELEDLEDQPTGAFSSFHIPNLTFPHLPSAQELGLVLRRLKQTERCPQPPAEPECGTCSLVRLPSGAFGCAAARRCSTC